jgi:ZIP family zinc transporter
VLEPLQIVWLGTLASLVAGLGTVVGAVGIFLVRRLSDRTEDILLSSAAGIMLAASFFSLLLPGIEYGEAVAGDKSLAVLMVIGGLLLGAAALYLIHRHLPHEHFITGKEGPDAPTLRRIWLFVIAITLHNFPEGMAVGVGFAGGSVANGVSLATGIGLQNVPEGLAVAASLLAIDYTRTQAFLAASLTGLVEPVGGLVGSSAVWLAQPLMPWVLGFAAGAMLFIISDEIIPETHRGEHKDLATFSLLGGFAVMMFLDATLG